MEQDDINKVKFGIQKKFSLMTMLFLLIFAGIVTFINTRLQQTTIQERFFENAKAITSLLKESSLDPLMHSRLDLLKAFLEHVKEDPEVSYAYIYDKGGHILVDGTQENALKGTVPTDEAGLNAIWAKQLLIQKLPGIYDIALPLYLLDEKVGCVRVGFSLARAREVIVAVRDRNILWGLIFICLGLLFADLVSGMVTRPLLKLTEKTLAVSKGDLSQRMKIGSNDELEILGISFNRMVNNLAQTTVSKQYVDNIIHSMADSLIVLGPQENIKTVNQATVAMLGYEEHALMGKSMRLVLPSFQGLSQPQANVLSTASETTYITKDGREIPVSFSAALMHEANGSINGMVCVAKDITEKKKMTQLLLEKTQDLERSNHELEQFAYIASHDLQEPLRMVSSYTKLLQQKYAGKLDGDADDFMMFAVDGALRMRALIDDLLMYSRAGTQAKPPELVDTNVIFERATTNLKMAIADNHATVTRADLPKIMADPVAMTQLFQNLIGNAIKFHGPQPPVVHVTCEKKGEYWLFSVRDNGIGIDPKDFNRIFEIFQRLHSREKYPGTGIGLAVCKKIVERHGGRLWPESQLGAGTTFFFTIPKIGGGDGA